ncbi:MAG TPA: lactonase family protein [Chitinophagaceae bacterium]|nr:lactonase family protein [Chitinophagaceae bacterium]
MLRCFGLIAVIAIICTSCGSVPVAGSDHDHYLLVGTYTSGGSYGIYSYKFDLETGDFTVADSVQAADPSYLTVSANNNFVYAVNEVNGKEGNVTSYSFDRKTGKLKQLNQQPSGGIAPCYISTNNSADIVVVGNYMSGTVSVYPLNADGTLKPSSALIKHEGKGPDSNRQEGPHVHATVFSPDEKYLFVPDLGIDKVMIYPVDAKSGKLGTASFVAVDPGSGPRHFVFDQSGNHAYLLQELSGTVTVFDYDGNGKLTAAQTISSVPADYQGPRGSADIHVSPDRKFLYASNRGQSNTLAIFKIDPANGKLTAAGHQSTLGKIPRNFSFDPSGNFLLAANQESNDIVIFKIDHATGMLTPLDKRINVSKPVCLKWAE